MIRNSDKNRKKQENKDTKPLKMTFQKLYELEKMKTGGARPQAFLERVSVAAIVSTETVYQWALGWRNPNKAAAKLVADLLGMKAEELFPNQKPMQQ